METRFCMGFYHNHYCKIKYTIVKYNSTKEPYSERNKIEHKEQDTTQEIVK